VVEQRYQLKWEEEHVFEVDAPTTEEFPLGSITADELREKYVFGVFRGREKALCFVWNRIKGEPEELPP